MRLKNLILGDMKFQYKYGFYTIYLFLVVLYACIFFALPESARQKAALIMILTDPAAMGLFFMGAILMLEKSQRVIDTIAITPVRVWEYIISKAVSISVISILVSIILAVLSGNSNLFGIVIGTLFGSIIFTMIGLLIAVHTNSLNSFMIGTVPIELIFFVPAILYLFGLQSDWMLLHPACAIMQLYIGVTNDAFLSIIVCIVWAVLILFITCKAFQKMIKQMGGIKL
jgi:fluoroquinolone transport system permease protein